MIRALQVDLQHQVPVLLLHPQHQPVPGDPRVIDQDVQPSPLGHDSIDRLAHLFRPRDVELDGQGLATFLRDLLGGFLGSRQVEIGHRHIGTGTAQGLGDGLADPLRATGNQGDFSL